MKLEMIDQMFGRSGAGIDSLDDLRDVQVILGIPFNNEEDSLPGVVKTAIAGAEQIKDSVRVAIVCIGSQEGKRALDQVGKLHNSESDILVGGFLLDREHEGRGWSCRMLLEIAEKTKAALVLLAPDLEPQEDGKDVIGFGFSPYWIEQMVASVIKHDQDLALAKFNRHILAHAVDSLFTFPVMQGVFGVSLRQPLSEVCALSFRMIRACLNEKDYWPDESGMFGFYPWLSVQAVVSGYNICEVPLGIASFQHEFGKLKPIFRQVAHIMFRQVVEYSKWWLERSALLSAPGVLGPNLQIAPPAYRLQYRQLVRRFKMEFNHFDDTLYQDIVPRDLRTRLENLADQESQEPIISAQDWVDVLGRFLLAYGFERQYHPDDIIDGLYPFFLARLVTLIREMERLESAVISHEEWGSDKQQIVIWNASEGILAEQSGLIADKWMSFGNDWHKREIESGPYLPRLGAWEFVPHVGVMVPQQIEKPDGGLVWASQLYQEQTDRYRGQFVKFVKEHLLLDELSDSAEILKRVRQFMHKFNGILDERLFPFDLASLEGASRMVDEVFANFASANSFQLTSYASRFLLQRNPPRMLMVQLGYGDVGRLLESKEPNDALALAAWFDRQDYLDRILDIIEKEGERDWFHQNDLKPLVVDSGLLKYDDETRGTTALTRLAGRVVMSNYDRGWGGEFPKLRFFLLLVKRIIGIELFSEAWLKFAEEDVDFPERVVNSIRGHWGRRVLSAHNVFENRHQRLLVNRLKNYTDQLLDRGPEYTQAIELLRAAADIYHLSVTLPDTTFVPLSAWTWASYSYRGGLGTPTPLSSLVERDWATSDFLVSYLERAGRGGTDTVNQAVLKLMADGRESEDLGEILLGMTTDSERLVVVQTPQTQSKPAAKLVRPVSGPILMPVPDHAWESRYVLNAAAFRLNAVIYIVYRAFGDDQISRLGLAWTKDGVNIEGRLDTPIFSPQLPEEAAGCEDPRITVLDDRLYMMYTAFDGTLPQIALASISVQEFLDGRYEAWKRHGLGFPGLANKDAVLYPEKFDGRYAIYHRIDPNMWLSYLDDLSCPWPRSGHKMVIGPRSSMMWDGVKIGAGAQPIKTTHGWLNIYHGVDYQKWYRLGVLFMDLENPSEVLYQSPNPILEPEQDFETGKSENGDYWVPRVVFTCGAVPMKDKPVLEPNDEVLVYYGAADTSIGVAIGRLNELVPIIDSKT